MPTLTNYHSNYDRHGSPLGLENPTAYSVWRRHKLKNYPVNPDKLIVEISDMAQISRAELGLMYEKLRKSNMVIYSNRIIPDGGQNTRNLIGKFARQFGLDFAEAHRSAGEESVVAVNVSDQSGKRGYIPYSNKPLNWHTDGYYNAPDETIGAFILHCVNSAADGGQNQLLDPDIAYIRLRDENPAYIAALSHPQAMTIPFSKEVNGKIRPDSVGPVFKILPDGSGINMRYTARTRSISWRDDAATREAVAFLNHLLDGNEPLIQTVKLLPGQGLINNNVLHNRSGFENSAETGKSRLLYRVRFMQRIIIPAHDHTEGRTHENQ